MLKYRIISGTLFLSLVAAMALWAPTWVAVIFVIILAGLGTLETVSLMKGAGLHALQWTTLSIAGLIMTGAWMAAAMEGGGWLAEHLIWIMPALSAWLIFLGCLFRSDQSVSLSKVTSSFFTIAYVPGLIQFFILLLYTKGVGAIDGRMLLVYGVLVIKFTDIGAYFTGRAIGKHKLIPKISPAKTWEGVIGGVVVCTLVSLLFMWLMNFQISGLHFVWWDAILLPLILGPAGVLGDLVESMLKRSASIKDSGSWVRGMGGILDVLDSLLFAVPALYLYSQWVLLRG